MEGVGLEALKDENVTVMRIVLRERIIVNNHAPYDVSMSLLRPLSHLQQLLHRNDQGTNAKGQQTHVMLLFTGLELSETEPYELSTHSSTTVTLCQPASTNNHWCRR